MLTARRVPVNRVQALLKLARQVLDEQHGPDPGPVSVVIVRGQLVTVSSDQAAEQAVIAAAPTAANVGPLQRRILQALTASPQTARRLASSVRHRCNSYFYEQLRLLVDADPQLIRRVSWGYRLP